jgi:hypothetical protein
MLAGLLVVLAICLAFQVAGLIADSLASRLSGLAAWLSGLLASFTFLSVWLLSLAGSMNEIADPLRLLFWIAVWLGLLAG